MKHIIATLTFALRLKVVFNLAPCKAHTIQYTIAQTRLCTGDAAIYPVLWTIKTNERNIHYSVSLLVLLPFEERMFCVHVHVLFIQVNRRLFHSSDPKHQLRSITMTILAVRSWCQSLPMQMFLKVIRAEFLTGDYMLCYKGDLRAFLNH